MDAFLGVFVGHRVCVVSNFEVFPTSDVDCASRIVCVRNFFAFYTLGSVIRTLFGTNLSCGVEREVLFLFVLIRHVMFVLKGLSNVSSGEYGVRSVNVFSSEVF